MKYLDSKWIEVKIITRSEDIESFNGILYDIGITQVAIEDPSDILDREQGPLTWDFADINIFEYGDKAATLKFYIKENANEIIEKIKKSVSDINNLEKVIGEYKILSSEIFEEDWANTWKKYYKPTKIGKNIVIKPIWEDYKENAEEVIINMDPGMAFGTGTHETTRMCIEALEKYITNGKTVFDIGTGSGILAIAASKLGAKKVIGVDIDPVAVDSANQNVQLNNTNNINILFGNLLEVVSEKADIIVANIIAEVIISMIEDGDKLTKPNGIMITSGIIKDRKDDVIKAFATSNFKVIEVNTLGEWVCIVAEKEGE